MIQPSVSQPPQVSWLDPEDRDSTPNAWVMTVTINQLVNTVWSRIPEPARAIIALDLREVLLLGDWEELDMYFETNQVMLCLDSREPSPQWELSVMWRLAEGFGFALVWSMVARMAGGPTDWAPLPEKAQGTPASAWYQSFHGWPGRPNAYQDMTWQLADAIALGWGFGEERAAAMHNAESPDGRGAEEEPLIPASGNISWLFRE